MADGERLQLALEFAKKSIRVKNVLAEMIILLIPWQYVKS